MFTNGGILEVNQLLSVTMVTSPGNACIVCFNNSHVSLEARLSLLVWGRDEEACTHA